MSPQLEPTGPAPAPSAPPALEGLATLSMPPVPEQARGGRAAELEPRNARHAIATDLAPDPRMPPTPLSQFTESQFKYAKLFAEELSQLKRGNHAFEVDVRPLGTFDNAYVGHELDLMRGYARSPLHAFRGQFGDRAHTDPRIFEVTDAPQLSDNRLKLPTPTPKNESLVLAPFELRSYETRAGGVRMMLLDNSNPENPVLLDKVYPQKVEDPRQLQQMKADIHTATTARARSIQELKPPATGPKFTYQSRDVYVGAEELAKLSLFVSGEGIREIVVFGTSPTGINITDLPSYAPFIPQMKEQISVGAGTRAAQGDARPANAPRHELYKVAGMHVEGSLDNIIITEKLPGAVQGQGGEVQGIEPDNSFAGDKMFDRFGNLRLRSIDIDPKDSSRVRLTSIQFPVRFADEHTFAKEGPLEKHRMVDLSFIHPELAEFPIGRFISEKPVSRLQWYTVLQNEFNFRRFWFLNCG